LCAVTQTISYEVSLAMILLSFVFSVGRYKSHLRRTQKHIW